MVGENGAGKSTLMRVLGGEHRPDAGEIRIDGKAVRLSGPVDAIARGHQRHPPGDGAGPRSDRGGEHLPRRASGPDRLGRAEREGARPDRAARLRHLAAPHGVGAFGRTPAGGGDRESPVAQGPACWYSTNRPRCCRWAMRSGSSTSSGGFGAVAWGSSTISHRLDEIYAISDRITVLKGRPQGRYRDAPGSAGGRSDPHDGRAPAEPALRGEARALRRRGDPEGGSADASQRDQRRVLHAPPGRGRGSGRARGFGSDGGGAGDLRGRSDRLGDADAPWAALQAERAEVRREGRDRAGAGGPQGPGRGPRHGHRQECDDGAHRAGDAGGLLLARGGAADRAAADRRPAHQARHHDGPGIEPVGRQPAEGRAREVVPRGRRGGDPRRAHARRRRGRQDRDLFADPPDGVRGEGGARHLLRNMRSCSGSATGCW